MRYQNAKDQRVSANRAKRSVYEVDVDIWNNKISHPIKPNKNFWGQ